MQERYDVIVIGAGLGGMLAAAILARRGRRVLLLERERQLGGRLQSFAVDGYVIDAGAYLWPNLHLDPALAAAGATEFRGGEVPPTQVLRVFVQGHGGRRFAFPWPGRPESPELLEAAGAVLRAAPATLRQLGRLWEELAALSDAEVAALAHVPLREALPRFAPDPDVAAAFRRNVMIFGSYDPDSASMAECIGLRRRRPIGAHARPECPGPNAAGGVRALPLALQKALAAGGVDVRPGWTVDHIAIEGGRAAGVLAHPNEVPFQQRFASPVVICNVPIWQALDLVAPEQFSDDFVAESRRCGVVGGAISAAFVFDGLPRRRETGEVDEFPGWTRLLIGPDAWFGGGLLWATRHSPHNAPPGQHVLQAMRLSPRRDVTDARRVAEIHAAFRAMLDEIYLDVADRLRWSRTWIMRDGSEYMVHAAPRPSVQAPGVDGLYFVGETTDVPAVQMDAAALSALRCADLVAG